MNSGIRFSVALIVVIMVLIGFYYASLDDGATEGDGGSATPQISVEGAETTDSTPVATPREAEVERRPAEPERPVRLVDETDAVDATDDETAVDADGTTGGDFDEFLVDSTPDSTPDADAVGDSAGTETPDATNGPDVTDGDESSDAMESDEVDESVADEEDASSTTDVDVTETVESVVERVEQSRPETRLPVGTARPARNPRAAGVGIHRSGRVARQRRPQSARRGGGARRHRRPGWHGLDAPSRR